MGLDMYLSARKHINKIDWQKLDRDSDTKYSDATFQQWNDVVNAAGVATLVKDESIYGVDVSVNVAYWRKVNSVHRWFVDNVQGGVDDCDEYYVDLEMLKKLGSDCQKILDDHSKAPDVLPTTEGFFFGSYEKDEWYYKDLENTVRGLERALSLPDSYEFYYRASW